MPRRRKRLLAIAAALAALAVAIGLVAQYNKESRAAVQKAPASVPVTAAPVIAKTVPVRLIAIGNVEPFTTVAVKARVDGQIVSVHFKEGDEVAKGALLFEIDPRPLAATLKQAQANLLKDKALLDRAVEQEKRYKDLLQKNFISPDAYEQVKTNMDSAAATVRGDEATIESARLQLEYCTIRSPVTGYAGKIAIQQGNLVKANDTNPLVTINQIVPIYASFSVPEQNIPDIRKYQADGVLQVQAGFANSTRPLINGKLSFIDNTADMTTGTIKLKAEFPNVDKALWPGQFVNVVMTLVRPEGRRRRAVGRRAERTQRPVRLRRQARHDRRAAQHQGRRAPRVTTRSSPAACSRATRSSPSASCGLRPAPGSASARDTQPS